jgi:hypothetical protein
MKLIQWFATTTQDIIDKCSAKSNADICFKEVFGMPMQRDEFDVSDMFGGNTKENSKKVAQFIKNTELQTPPQHNDHACFVLNRMANKGVKFSAERIKELSSGVRNITKQYDGEDPLSAFIVKRPELMVAYNQGRLKRKVAL